MDCSYRGQKQIEKTLWLCSYIFSRIHFRIKTKLHCSGNFPFDRPIGTEYGLWTRAMGYGLAKLCAHRS